jgi:Tfp pilus assembly protein PilF
MQQLQDQIPVSNSFANAAWHRVLSPCFIAWHRVLAPCIIILFILCMPGCQTLKDPAAEAKREEDLLNTQKNLVIGYINQGQPNMALRELRPLMKKHPQDADFKNLMGLTYLSLQNPKMALGFFEESHRLQPRASVALNLSSAYIETKQYSKAMKTLKELRNSPAGKDYQYPERILHNLALCAERMNKEKIAEKYYKLAIEVNPYYYLSLMRLGQLYERTRNTDLALREYQKAREACRKCFDPIHALVTQWVAQGDTPKAMALIQEYLTDKELDPAERMKARKLLASTSKRDPKNLIHARNGRMRPSRSGTN